jgi:glycosyltransferase involved in cell wall biosynthesis
LVYAEAMAAGLPVIATKCGGPEDIIIDCEEGLLIEVDDRDALEAAMRYMILNVDNFDRSTISKNALHRFSPERIAIELINIYSDVLNLGYSYD